MPPRIPVVFLFVVIYFAVAWGGGVAAPSRELAAVSFTGMPRWFDDLFGLPTLRLSFADVLALGAAVLALPDSALRLTRSGWDRLMSLICAGVAVGVLALEPLLFAPGYAILLALCFGDVLGSFGQAIRPSRKPAPMAMID